ncbi:MAG: hypothetical protein LBJ12_02935 [Oscillospiraceae bacterium]|jgi:hypothetical protein|nr:hypothetical protein [Oscillospiraceae bacterium]
MGKTEAEVIKKKRQALTALENGTYVEPTRLTIEQWLCIWTQEYLGAVKPGTRKTYHQQITLHIVPALGALPLQRLMPAASWTTYINPLFFYDPKQFANRNGYY